MRAAASSDLFRPLAAESKRQVLNKPRRRLRSQGAACGILLCHFVKRVDHERADDSCRDFHLFPGLRRRREWVGKVGRYVANLEQVYIAVDLNCGFARHAGAALDARVVDDDAETVVEALVDAADVATVDAQNAAVGCVVDVGVAESHDCDEDGAEYDEKDDGEAEEPRNGLDDVRLGRVRCRRCGCDGGRREHHRCGRGGRGR
mmetsp:Transcript_24415/g.56287  ORF Transcript_24415/g.56287 Transcript_24415/m.56287 type:complete len:204 (-) Transcript_24415:318-929(-)